MNLQPLSTRNRKSLYNSSALFTAPGCPRRFVRSRRGSGGAAVCPLRRARSRCSAGALHKGRSLSGIRGAYLYSLHEEHSCPVVSAGADPRQTTFILTVLPGRSSPYTNCRSAAQAWPGCVLGIWGRRWMFLLINIHWYLPF